MTKNKVFIFFTLLVLSFMVKSQTPSEDPNHYILDTEDNFNSLNSSLWNTPPYGSYTWGWGLETFHPNNVNVSGGILTLKTEKVGNSYISGGVETVNKKAFSYGYFEIEAKLPAKGTEGPWGGFWFHTGEGGWDEIDVWEPNGCDAILATSFHSGTCATHNGIIRGTPSEELRRTGFPDLSANFNKFALIWTPQYVKVLFNGNIVFEEVEPNYIPTHPMFLFLTAQVDAGGCDPDPSKPFPTKYWQFKNFKYYSIKTDCSNGISQSNFNFNGHDYKVQKYYLLSNSIIPNNSNITLRATDYIQFNGEFTVPLGSTFTAITHCNTCPD